MIELLNKRSMSYKYRGWTIKIYKLTCPMFPYDVRLLRKKSDIWSATTYSTFHSAIFYVKELIDNVIDRQGKPSNQNFYPRKRMKREYLHRTTNGKNSKKL